MNTSETTAGVSMIEIEITINAPREEVWRVMFEKIDQWWIADFRVVGQNSKVTFDSKAGGNGILEKSDDGGWLQWYEVQMYLPADFKVYLFGNVAPEWGGPSTSNLMIALEESDSGCVFKLSDARHGSVDAGQSKCCEDGWRQLFTDGLKKYVESK